MWESEYDKKITRKNQGINLHLDFHLNAYIECERAEIIRV
ncbi:hypothetical protein EBGED10_45380 [Bacillus sp. GeD10]|nr:hypothetical protein EBGED10_45380 [Bacillus sp. GeD10]